MLLAEQDGIDKGLIQRALVWRYALLNFLCLLQTKMGATKDFEMSPFEAARKLLSLEAQHLSLGQQSDLIFQDMDLVPLLIQENYLNHRPIISQSDASRMQVDCQLHIMLAGLSSYVLLSDKYHSFNVTILWNTVLIEMGAVLNAATLAQDLLHTIFLLWETHLTGTAANGVPVGSVMRVAACTLLT